MKQLICEMCGSTDLIKQDGVFVCQSCGTKYSVDEAKKMMVEGTVDVSGSTVKVDTSAELANLYQIARRAKDDHNSENTAKYYDMILVKDPTSWEAAFYVVYFKAMECKIAQIRSAAISVSNCQDSVLYLIKNHVPESEQLAAVKEIVYRSSRIAHMLANGAKNHYDGINYEIKHNYTQEYVDNAGAARDILYTCGTQIDRIFGDDPQIGKLAAEAWKDGIEIHKQLLSHYADKDGHNRIIDSYIEKIGKYFPNYLNDHKKKKLETEIANLKRVVSQEPNEGSFQKLRVVRILSYIVFIAAYFSERFLLKYSDEWIYTFIFGAGLAIIITLFKERTMKRKKEKAEKAKNELEEKEAELKKL